MAGFCIDESSFHQVDNLPQAIEQRFSFQAPFDVNAVRSIDRRRAMRRSQNEGVRGERASDS